MNADKRRAGIALLAGVALLAVAIPVLAASPSPSTSAATASPVAPATSAPSPEASAAPATASPTPSATPTASPAPIKPDVTAAPAETSEPDETSEPAETVKPDKGPETTISLTGTVEEGVDGKGRPAYTMTVGGTTWSLSAGPPWFWGDNNPLAAYVGKTVTVAGTTHAGDTEIDVETVDGKALRAPGKPPWAGGPWVVGPTHPGWKDWMAGGKPGKGLGRESAPGQLKKVAPSS